VYLPDGLLLGIHIGKYLTGIYIGGFTFPK